MTDGAAPRLSVVVPAFQESGVIGASVEALRRVLTEPVGPGGLEILVVDDGSTDTTAAEADRAGSDRVVSLPSHRGKGAAVRAGMLAARGATVAFCDADLAYPPDQLLRLLPRIEGGWDVAVGSRRRADSLTLVELPLVRRVTSRFYSTFTRRFVPGRPRDTQCGIKAFSATAARQVFERVRTDGFAFDVEIFFIARRLDLSLTEVGVELSNSRRSSVRVERDVGRMVLDTVRIGLRARQGAYQ